MALCRPSYLLTLLALLYYPLVVQAAENPAPVKGETIEGLTQYSLPNGLQILLYPDPSKPTVTVNLTILVGSRHEGYGETGMAHLLEHMVFKGTPDHPHVPKDLQQHGARFNGTTWVDRTNYYETMPTSPENLEFGIKLEADRMINSFIRQEDLFSEMTVVRNEFERGENSPQALLNQRMLAVAYDWHNYGKPTIGNRVDIERVPIKNLQAFYAKYYQPDNALLIVAGKFDTDQALKLIQDTFGAIPRPKRKLDKTYTEEPPQDGERSVTLRRVGDVSLVGAMYHAPSGAHPDAAPLDVLGQILDSPPSGRLYKALVETHKATHVAAGLLSYHDAGIFEVYAELRKEDSVDAARDLLLSITEDVGKTKITQAEVDRAKQQLLKAREMAASDTSRIAVELSNWASQGDWRLYFLHRDRTEKVTPEEVQAVAEKYLKPANRTLGIFIPSEKSAQVAIPETPDLEKMFNGYKGHEQIAGGEAFDVSPTNIEARAQRYALPGGLKVVLLPKKTRGETVEARVTLRYGGPDSLRGYEAAADFMAALMLRGTKNMTRQQIEDELDKNKATIVASGSTSVAVFTLETKKENLPAVLKILQQILREPTFPADEFEVLRRQQLAGLEEQLTDPQSLATTQISRTVSPYDKQDVRYIPTSEEEITRTKALQLDQIKKLYANFLSAQNGEVVVVGDMDVEKTKEALSTMFAGWTTQQPYVRIPRKAFTDVRGSRQEIATPDKANAVYIAAQIIPMKDDDPDYPALLMGDYLLGGGTLSSRLADRVRQKDGLSYGVGSHFGAESLDPRASLTIYAICNPVNMPKVETAIREEIVRLLKDGIPADELEKAKKGFLQAQEVARTNDSYIVGRLGDTAHLGRTMAYYSDLEKKVQALKPEDVTAAMKKYFDPDRLSLVEAGDFKAKPGNEKPAKDK